MTFGNFPVAGISKMMMMTRRLWRSLSTSLHRAARRWIVWMQQRVLWRTTIHRVTRAMIHLTLSWLTLRHDTSVFACQWSLCIHMISV